MNRALPCFCTIYPNNKALERPGSHPDYFMVMWGQELVQPNESLAVWREDWISRSAKYHVIKGVWRSQTAVNWQTNGMISGRSQPGKRCRWTGIRTAGWKEKITRGFKGNAKFSNRDFQTMSRWSKLPSLLQILFSFKIQHRRLLILTDNRQSENTSKTRL